MVTVNKTILLFLLLLTSCAKVGYLVEQGVGQVKLLTEGKDNSEILNDVRYSSSDKDKIRKIQKYKKYFYEYWDKKETSIYSKTTILHDTAVTYLVISSEFNKIEPREECFPIMGCFPYLGFFKKSSATNFAEDLNKRGIITYTRPVYAYSTLGYFTDTILSSFFYFDDFELAELIFHELFHTIFFIKDEVELNENLANYFGKQMALEYFKDDLELNKKIKLQHTLNNEMSEVIVRLARILDTRLRQKVEISQSEASKVVQDFVIDEIKPQLSTVCTSYKITDDKCYFMNREWNQASLAAFMTYENKTDELLVLRKRISGDLKDFFHYIEKEFNKFSSANDKKNFSDWLLDTSRSSNEKTYSSN